MRFLLFVIVFLFSVSAFAQTDSISVKIDATAVDPLYLDLDEPLDGWMDSAYSDVPEYMDSLVSGMDTIWQDTVCVELSCDTSMKEALDTLIESNDREENGEFIILPYRTRENRDSLYYLVHDHQHLRYIDSLMAEGAFETYKFSADTTELNIYAYPPDSVPLMDSAAYAGRLRKLDSNTPFHLVYNDYVKAFIHLYAVKKRDLTSKVLGLAPIYFPMFEETLDKYDLPLEFKYLAVVESALNPRARSSAGAKGLWQFMYWTGKTYGLQVTSYIDERSDPYKATDAACRHFIDLYKVYKDWNLVLAAYNSGPGNVNKAIRRSGGKKDFWEIRPYLPQETRGYVPAFIAVNYIMNYANEHNIYPIIPEYECYRTDTVHVKEYLPFEKLSETLNIDIELIKFLNPAYRYPIIPKNGSIHTLRLPIDDLGAFLINEKAIYNYKTELERKDSLSYEKSKQVAEENLIIHKVRSGEYLGYIAKRYNVTVSQLMRWNNLHNTRINIGQRLYIYGYNNQ